MDEKVYDLHYRTIRDLVENYGIDTTDDYLRQELSSITKDVVILREKVGGMKQFLNKITNTDEIIHVQYDIEDANRLLESLLNKLKTADERYVCYKEYLKRKR